MTTDRPGRVVRPTPGRGATGAPGSAALIQLAAETAAACIAPVFESMRDTAGEFRSGDPVRAAREFVGLASALRALAETTVRLADVSTDEHRVLATTLVSRLGATLDAVAVHQGRADWAPVADLLDGALTELLFEWGVALFELRDAVTRPRVRPVGGVS